MKIETEVSLFADTKSGGCSSAVDPPRSPTAQVGQSSIGLGCGRLQNNDEHLTQRGFDCEHFQFIDEEEEDDVQPEETTGGDEELTTLVNMSGEPQSAVVVTRQVSFNDADGPKVSLGEKGLKSLLKKGSRSSSKRRVTFNEAVSLYSDEHEGVRLLQLTTGQDVVCTDAFYMFEPPIEYQDVPPFEPPAEYRDPDDQSTPPTLITSDLDVPKTEPEGQSKHSDPAVAEEVCNEAGNDIGTTLVCNSNDGTAMVCNRSGGNNDTAVVCNKTGGDNGTTMVQQQEEDSVRVMKEDNVKDAAQTVSDPTVKDRDSLFERFLEAEREFAVDEELNSVFHELDSDFANDGESGALDDNFFRKLITLLSSAEGDAPLEDGDFLSSTQLNSDDQEAEEDDNSQTHSRTLSEADSDCSISSQDTIIVRLGEEDIDQRPDVPKDDQELKPEEVVLEKQDIFDEVFNNEESPRPLPRESLVMKNMQMHQAAVKLEQTNEESLSRQSSGEQSVTSQDPPQDADDSTSSDSRSGEVEEEIKLDDIGYDEEDADDYDEESFRGMARGNSKIRRIIKKNALQCTLFKGIEAKRRQQPGAKYPRPKSPLLSQESLVEKLKWLTTVDDHKDPLNFHSKPPDVILSTGEIPMNGSSEDNRAAMYQQQFYQMQRFAMPPSNKGGYYVRQDGYHASLPRQRMACPGHQVTQTHNLAYAPARMVGHPANSQQVQWSEQRNMTVPRNFRDWRVIQRVMVNRSGDGSRSPKVPADYVRCSNGTFSPPDVSRTSQLPRHQDELEQFVEQDSQRLDKLRKRYSMAEETDEDPTFGFARRPSVRGVQTQLQPNPSDHKLDYSIYEEGGHMSRAAYVTDRMWGRDPSWRPTVDMVHQRPLHIHRASVALTELPGCATIPYAHRKPHPDPRYHSYAESMYGSTRTLPTKGVWDPRSCNVQNTAAPQGNPGSYQTLQMVAPQMLQVPSKGDERGVPEGASSSPKISSDSLYHSSVSDSGGKEEGVIYYSLNV